MPVWLARLLLVGGVGYALWLTLLLLLQRQMIYPGRHREAPEGPPAEAEGLERLWRDVPGGRVEAWWWPAEDASAESPAPMVVLAHGNAELIDDQLGLARLYREGGVSVLMPEYRGYGRSGGSPSSAGIIEDFRGFYDRLAERAEVDEERVVLHGRSLGGGPVAALARQRPPAALILESCFTSLASFAPRYLAPPFLLRDRFPVRPAVAELDVPALVLHGRRDEIVPFAHGRRLAEAAGTEVVAFDAGHNDMPVGGRDYVRALERFLRGVGILHEGDEGEERTR